jgi:flagellar hook assembly protein FlgD
VSVALIDATGRLVRRLLDGPHPAGDYSLKWDGKDDAGRDLPAGMYFTHVTMADGTTTGRVVLTR